MISTVLRKAGEKTDSSALKADGIHQPSLFQLSSHRGDIIITYYTGRTYFDLLFSVIIAFIIIFSAFKIFRDGVGGLMDASIPRETEKKLQEIIDALPFPYAGYHKMRGRVAGSRKYTDFHLLICRKESIDEAHELAERLEITMTREVSNLDVVIHIEPCPNECELTDETCTVPHRELRHSSPAK